MAIVRDSMQTFLDGIAQVATIIASLNLAPGGSDCRALVRSNDEIQAIFVINAL